MDWFDEHQGLAAWVQAVGSLLALAIAIALPYLEKFRRGRENQAAAVETIGIAVGYARMVCERLSEWDSGVSKRTAVETLKANEQAIWNVAHRELGRRAISGKCLGIGVAYRTFVGIFGEYSETTNLKEQHKAAFDYYLKHLNGMYAELLLMTKQKDDVRFR